MATSIAAARFIAGVLPAILLILAAFVIDVLALALGADRREYALAVVDRLVSLASVVVGQGA
jgi:hypothetical protein